MQKVTQSDAVNELQNKIHGLETAQKNLIAYLEAGKATKTILDKMNANEESLRILKKQLEGTSTEIASVDASQYKKLTAKFRNYMCTVKSPEAAALKRAIIQKIYPDADDVTIYFNHGIPIDNSTKMYFDFKQKGNK
jgi:NAD+--asparagine ADP-ribosyltransferase